MHGESRRMPPVSPNPLVGIAHPYAGSGSGQYHDLRTFSKLAVSWAPKSSIWIAPPMRVGGSCPSTKLGTRPLAPSGVIAEHGGSSARADVHAAI